MISNAIAELGTIAARSGCSVEDFDRISRHLADLPACEAARINPLTFAEAVGIDEATSIDLFVHGAKFGLFDLEWGMVCPSCGGITQSVDTIDNVAEDVVHCALCNKDTDSVLDDTVEVTFNFVSNTKDFDVHADFATYKQYFTSSSFPLHAEFQHYQEQNTVGDIKLAPGQTELVWLTLDADERYRLICFDTHSGAEVVAVDAPPKASELVLNDRGFSGTEVEIGAGGADLTLTNMTSQPVWIRVIRVDPNSISAILKKGPMRFGPRLTGKMLLNNQAFRDNFAMQELAPDLKLKLRSLTLLFTDLKGSTALYDREGDIAAYRLVQDHFVALTNVVRSHSGAVIKTMGDAVMAAFPRGDDGAAAAVDMLAAMRDVDGGRRSNKVGLKIGLHTGPALAINAGKSLDYFGQTVNIAARVQGLAEAGEICLTRALNDNAAIPGILAESGYQGRSERARLKGVSGEEQVYRYRAIG